MSEIDTYEIRRQIRKYNDLGASEIIALCDALDEARAEVMAHQVGDGYEKGYEHGTLNAARYLVRAEKAEAAIERVEAAIDIATFDDERLEWLINKVRAALDGEVS